MTSSGGQADGTPNSALWGTGERDGSRDSVRSENGGRTGSSNLASWNSASWNSASWNSASWNSHSTALNALGEVAEASARPTLHLVDAADVAVPLANPGFDPTTRPSRLLPAIKH